MKRRRTFVILALIAAILLAPIIPSHRIAGAMFYGTFTKYGPIVGFGRGECVEQMLSSLLYLVTGIGPTILLNLSACI